MLELLPRGVFKIDTQDYGTITGKFGTYALKMFADRHFNGSLTELFNAIATGLTISLMTSLLDCAIQYRNLKDPESEQTRLKLNEFDLLEILDEAGGFTNFPVLINHAFAGEPTKKKEGEAVSS